jgi:2-dehydro-3-deoxygluconokinase
MKVATFGEIMGRFEAEDNKRFTQVMPGNMALTFAGAEANVAASLSILGRESKYITALPNNVISTSCIKFLKSLDIECDIKLRDEGRFGLYFLETGANQRPSNVIYDRSWSTFSMTDYKEYDFAKALKGCNWLHLSGITPSLSKECADATLEIVKEAKKQNISVSFDLNYRGKLWNWGKDLKKKDLARDTMKKIMPFIDVVIGNEEDASDVLDIREENNDVTSGSLNISSYINVAKEVKRQYKNVSKVAFTLRESVSASFNKWGAILYDCNEEKAYFAPEDSGNYTPYEIKNIIDRVGGGDSFSAGLVFALTDDKLNNPQSAISFAVAASCLCHSIHGDINYSSLDEVMKLMNGNGSGRVIR